MAKKPKCTPEERATISRANGARSRGAVTEAGKVASRRSNLIHGLRAEAVTLETEDPAAMAANTRSWFDFYRPLSPGASALVGICARMDVMINRSYTYLDNALLMQGRNTREAWEAARAALLDSLVPFVTTAPDSGVIEDLKEFGHGLRWLIDQILCFHTLIDDYGFLPPAAWRDLARLLGADPDIDRLGKNETAYMIVQYALRSEPRPDEALIASLSAPERRPEALRYVDLAAMHPRTGGMPVPVEEHGGTRGQRAPRARGRDPQREG